MSTGSPAHLPLQRTTTRSVAEGIFALHCHCTRKDDRAAYSSMSKPVYFWSGALCRAALMIPFVLFLGQMFWYWPLVRASVGIQEPPSPRALRRLCCPSTGGQLRGSRGRVFGPHQAPKVVTYRPPDVLCSCNPGIRARRPRVELPLPAPTTRAHPRGLCVAFTSGARAPLAARSPVDGVSHPGPLGSWPWTRSGLPRRGWLRSLGGGRYGARLPTTRPRRLHGRAVRAARRDHRVGPDADEG